MASGLNINGCVLSYFEGTANLHFIQVVHSLLYIRPKCHFFSVVTLKYIIIIYKNVRGVLTSVRYCICKRYNVGKSWPDDQRIGLVIERLSVRVSGWQEL